MLGKFVSLSYSEAYRTMVSGVKKGSVPNIPPNAVYQEKSKTYFYTVPAALNLTLLNQEDGKTYDINIIHEAREVNGWPLLSPKRRAKLQAKLEEIGSIEFDEHGLRDVDVLKV